MPGTVVPPLVPPLEPGEDAPGDDVPGDEVPVFELLVPLVPVPLLPLCPLVEVALTFFAGLGFFGGFGLLAFFASAPCGKRLVSTNAKAAMPYRSIRRREVASATSDIESGRCGVTMLEPRFVEVVQRRADKVEHTVDQLSARVTTSSMGLRRQTVLASIALVHLALDSWKPEREVIPMRYLNRSNSASRFHLLAMLILLASLLVGLSKPAAAQDEDATPILTKAVETMSDVQSFRFELQTVRGESTILQNLELAGVEGAVQRPDRFQATITAKVAVVEIDVEVVGVGMRVWVTDPMASTETFIEITSGDPAVGEQLTNLINPDKLLLQAVGLVKEPTIDGTETLDGERTTRVVGTVNLADLPQFIQATPEVDGSDLLILDEMPITIWIDGDGHVVRMEVEGPLTKDESADVVRRLNLYDFDVPVEISEPVTAS